MKKISFVLCIFAIAIIVAVMGLTLEEKAAYAAPNRQVQLDNTIASVTTEASSIYVDAQDRVWYFSRSGVSSYEYLYVNRIIENPLGSFSSEQYTTNLHLKPNKVYYLSNTLGITYAGQNRMWLRAGNDLIRFDMNSVVNGSIMTLETPFVEMDLNDYGGIEKVYADDDSNDSVYIVCGDKIRWRYYDYTTSSYIYQNIPIAGGTNYGLLLNIAYDGANLWLTTENNYIIRQNIYFSSDFEVFSRPGSSFVEFDILGGITVDNNGDIWTADHNAGNGFYSRIMRYRVKEKAWNEYKIDQAFGGTVTDIAITAAGRVYCATTQGLKHVKGVFDSAASDLVSITPEGAKIEGNSIKYTTDERRVDFSAIVSPGASYALYSDTACTAALPGNRLNTPLSTGESTAQFTAWLKITAADTEGYTIYNVIVNREKRKLILKPKSYVLSYGAEYLEGWELVGSLLDSDTVDQLNIKTVFYASDILINGKGGYVGSAPVRITTFSYHANWDYTIITQTGTLDVIPRDISVTLSPLSKTYGSADPVLQYNITDGDLAFNDKISSNLMRVSCEDVGFYAINSIKIVRSEQDCTSNYNITLKGSELKINPLKIQVNEVNNLIKTKIYNQTAYASTAGVTLTTNILPADNEVTLNISGSFNSKNFLDANQITLIFSFAGNGAKNANYLLPDDYIITEGAKILQRELTISNVMAVNRTYIDDVYTVAINGGILNGVLEGDSVSFNLKSTGQIDDCSAGTNKFVSTAIILTGSDSANYYLTQPDYVTADIEPVMSEVYWEYQDIYIYNGQDQSATIKAYYLNLSGLRIDLATEIADDAIFKNKGLYTARAYMFELNGNYDIGTPETVLEIFPFKVVSSLIVSPQKTYDGTIKAVIANPSTDNIIDESVTLSFSAVYNTANVGANSIEVQFILSGKGNENYDAPDDYIISGSQVKINPFETSVIWSYQSQYIYNGLDRSDTVVAICKNIGGSDIALVVSFSGGTFVDAGSHKTTASLSDSNYRLTDNEVNIMIEKRQIEVSGLKVTTSKIYDGSANAAFNNDFISNVLPETAVLVPSAMYNSKNVTEASYITVSFTLIGAGADNYILPQGYTVSNANITALRISVSGYTVESVKFYDGSTVAQITGNAVSDIVDSEIQVEIKAEFDDCNCGERIVRVWFILHNNDWGNYIAPFEYTILEDARINQRPISVVWETDAEYIYNGQDRSDSVKAYYEDIDGIKYYMEVDFSETFKNAGSYTAAVMLIDNTNYQLTGYELNLIIEQLPIILNDFTLSDTKVFDGTTAAAISGWTHNIAEGDDAKLTINAFYNSQNVTEATLITVRFYLAGADSANYIKPIDYSIDDASITPLAEDIIWQHEDKYIYDGTNFAESISAKYIDIAGIEKALNIEFSSNFINAGRYSARASMKKVDGNYTLTGEWKNFTIEQLQISLQNLEITRQKAFDGGTTANVVEGYTTNIKDATTKLQINADYNTKGVNADSITVVFSFIDNAESNSNYILPLPIVITEGVKINPKSLTISGVMAENREFDGTNKVNLNSGILSGIIDNGLVWADLGMGEIISPNASFVPYAVTTAIMLNGADKDNYTLIQPVGEIKVTISAKIVEINWCEDKFVYTGYDQRSNVTATYLGVDGAVIGLTVSSDSEFKSYNETGYLFIASMRFDETNYLLPAVKTALYHIEKATLTDTTSDKTITYDGSSHGILISAQGFYGNDNIGLGNIQYGLSANNYGHTDNILKINAGSYEIYYKIIFDNYNTLTGNKKVIIIPQDTDVLWIYQEFIYNGIDQSNKVSAHIISVSSNSIYLSVSSNGIFKEAGEYTFTAVCMDTNYALNNPTLNISIAPVAVTVRINDLESKEGEMLKEPTCSVVSEAGAIFGTLDIILTKAPGLTTGYYPITGECSNSNYQITWINGTYTIQQVSISSSETQGDKIVNQITVQSALGLNPDNKLSVIDISQMYSNAGFSMSEGGIVTVKKAFNINIHNAENSIVPVKGVISVRILISEELRHEKNLMVVYIDDDGTVTDMNAVREDNFLVFNTNHFSTYAIVSAVGEKTGLSLILYIVLPLIALAVILLIFIIIKKMKRKNQQALALSSMLLVQGYISDIPQEIEYSSASELSEAEHTPSDELTDAAYHRHDISDSVWQMLVTGLPARKSMWGPDGLADRKFINAVFWILRTGVPWQDLPSDYGKWGSVYRRYIRWKEKGIWQDFTVILKDLPDFEWMKTLQTKAITASKEKD